MTDLSDAEWEVMKVLWQRAPLTASEVIDALAEPMQWRPNTVKTLLGRLVKKGALRFEQEGNRYIYRPAHSRERYVRREAASFLDRVFSGETAPMLVHLVRGARLKKEEIEELRRLLDEKEEKSR